MPGKNLFAQPFDDGTKSKLEVYKQYLQEWLPVFVSKKEPIWKEVQIFDFFSGKGCDDNGYHGSPLITLQVANDLSDYITANKINLRIIFNELDIVKYNALVENIAKFDKANSYTVEIYNTSFRDLFEKSYAGMKKSANFLFLDQNGIKEIGEDIFKKIIQLKVTDFLFFISSSFFKRFAHTKEFQKYFPTISSDIDSISYYHVHRQVLTHYKSLIPSNKEYYLAPFSIKKGSNIYGLIFGSNHTLGIEKFLHVAWKNDKLRGEANYNIDNENIDENRPTLFVEYNTPNKRNIFEKTLRDFILNKTLKTNADVYLFTLSEGFLLKDANIVLRKLKTERLINYTFPLISSNLHREKQISSITFS